MGGAERVLVVEDEPEVMALLRELLRRRGYEVQEARHGIDALVHLSAPEDEQPDLVILDICLPLEGGVNVLEFLRRTLHRRTPVIILTATATQEQEERIQQLGVSGYLRKPASSAALFSTVEKALGGGS
jgi:CheY-like chemotaxis protein